MPTVELIFSNITYAEEYIQDLLRWDALTTNNQISTLYFLAI